MVQCQLKCEEEEDKCNIEVEPCSVECELEYKVGIQVNKNLGNLSVI